MEKHATPSSSPSPAGIISQQLFDQYASSWVAASNDPAGTVLAQSFQVGVGSSSSVLAGLSFPALQIARLVSTVGAVHIKARFLISQDAEQKQPPHFTLALFATDALDTRISSYYVADEYWTPTVSRSEMQQEAAAARRARSMVTAHSRKEVPGVLANLWLKGWQSLTTTSEITPALFASSYGALRGYTYEVDEFVHVLRALTQLKNESVQLVFDLHEYYRPLPPQGDVLVRTFGLLLCVKNTKEENGEDGTFVNMSSPCPPTC